VTLVATTAASSGNTVVTFVDNGVYTPSPTYNTIATAATNTIYRGVAASPR